MSEFSGGENDNRLTKDRYLAQSVAMALDSRPQFNQMNRSSTYNPQERLDLTQSGFKMQMANTHGMSLEQIQRDHGVSIDVATRIQTERLDIAEEAYSTAYAEGQSVDGMTGLLNEVGFETVVTELLPLLADRINFPNELDLGKIQEAVFAVIMVDLNHLREVNNRNWGGHVMGDKLIIGIADCLKASIRTSDFAAHIGGDETMVGLPITQDMGVLPEQIVASLTKEDEDGGGMVVRLINSVKVFRENFYKELYQRGATPEELRELGVGTLSLGLVIFDRASLAQALDAYEDYKQDCIKTGIAPVLSLTNFALKPFSDKLMYQAKQKAHISGIDEVATGLFSIKTGGFKQVLTDYVEQD